ncbi:MAG: vitamin K epoxide reductase family protein [Chloroflexota bacterium]|jgi:uncharacterized membrane protein
MTYWKNFAIMASLIGIADSIYLTILKISNNKSLCIQGVGDCWSVNTSRYSEINGIPISLLGLAAYSFILLVLILGNRNDRFSQYSPYLLFGVTLIGVIYSGYLTYLEIAVIKAICPLCVISAIAMLILFVYALREIAMPTGNAS